MSSLEFRILLHLLLQSLLMQLPAMYLLYSSSSYSTSFFSSASDHPIFLLPSLLLCFVLHSTCSYLSTPPLPIPTAFFLLLSTYSNYPRFHLPATPTSFTSSSYSYIPSSLLPLPPIPIHPLVNLPPTPTFLLLFLFLLFLFLFILC